MLNNIFLFTILKYFVISTNNHEYWCSVYFVIIEKCFTSMAIMDFNGNKMNIFEH